MFGLLQSPSMRLRLSLPDKLVRRLTTLTLVLWLAGVGCAFGCEINTRTTTGDDKTQSSVDADSCPALSGECCHKSGSELTAPVTTTSSDNKIDHGAFAFSTGIVPPARQLPSCCPLVGFSADPARRADRLDAPMADAAIVSHASNIGSASAISTRPPRIVNKGSTRLRCCLFLI